MRRRLFEDAARSDETVGIVSAVGIAVVAYASGCGGMYECYCAGFVDINGHAYMPYPCLPERRPPKKSRSPGRISPMGTPMPWVYCADDEGLSNMSKLRNI